MIALWLLNCNSYDYTFSFQRCLKNTIQYNTIQKFRMVIDEVYVNFFKSLVFITSDIQQKEQRGLCWQNWMSLLQVTFDYEHSQPI